MRKLIYYLTASLDGFIARTDGSVDWLVDVEGEDFGFASFFERVDTVVMGRRTYETALSFGDYPYSSKEGYVFSRSLKHSAHAEIVSGSVREFINALKQKPGRDIWLVGGGEAAKSLFNDDLIDELIVVIQPVLLGTGMPLIEHVGRDIRLQLNGSQQLSAGLIQLDYSVVRGPVR